ncbi:MAG: transporter permease [Naasia sp.]|uniref:FecCD family ABC transporter permease n=1 Tax=Naasia sp. TaxID=2546198 RepID=UPI002611CC40|nr:iron chelate uptake ABC transporter family permease subunit [Naasia sp.]MCU1571001.1 transporter permease [Naasia sp.]
MTATPPATLDQAISGGRLVRRRRHAVVVGALVALLLLAAALTLCVGNTVYTPDQVLRAVLGERVPGASFTVVRLRLPRMLVGALAGIAFGLAGVLFQTMLGNVLASPDVIGISAGSSAAAVIGIALLGLSGAAVSVLAVAAGLAVALAIFALSAGGTGGSRLLLIGIGVGAMLQSVISYVLTRANVTEASEALRWLTGSLNGATLERVPPLALTVAVLAPIVLLLGRRLTILQLGDDAAAGLGVSPRRTRALLVAVAVGLLAVATATTGPIAFVAFLAGPIATRLLRGAGSPLAASALVGAALVLVADLGGANLFEARFPVGVITGAAGAPYLLWLLARTNRSGGSL